MKAPIDLNLKTNRGRHGQRREHILWTAEVLAAEAGLDSVTMSALARRVGVSSAALYKHFDSKQDLLGALALRVVQQLDAVLSAATRAEADSSWESLGRIIGAYAELYTRRPSSAVLVSAFVSDPRTLIADAKRAEVWAPMESWWARIEHHLEALDVPPDQAVRLGWTVWTTAQGVLMASSFAAMRGLEEPADALVRDAVYGLLAGSGLPTDAQTAALWAHGCAHGINTTLAYLEALDTL